MFLNESAARVKDSYILWFLVLNFSSIYTMRAKFSFMKKAIVSASVLHRDIFFFFKFTSNTHIFATCSVLMNGECIAKCCSKS